VKRVMHDFSGARTRFFSSAHFEMCERSSVSLTLMVWRFKEEVVCMDRNDSRFRAG
jgi:hypothetical protein